MITELLHLAAVDRQPDSGSRHEIGKNHLSLLVDINHEMAIVDAGAFAGEDHRAVGRCVCTL